MLAALKLPFRVWLDDDTALAVIAENAADARTIAQQLVAKHGHQLCFPKRVDVLTGSEAVIAVAMLTGGKGIE